MKGTTVGAKWIKNQRREPLGVVCVYHVKRESKLIRLKSGAVKRKVTVMNQEREV